MYKIKNTMNETLTFVDTAGKLHIIESGSEIELTDAPRNGSSPYLEVLVSGDKKEQKEKEKKVKEPLTEEK